MSGNVVIIPIIWFYITLVAVKISFSIVVSCVIISLLLGWYQMWVTVTTTWRLVRCRMEGTASGYGGWVRIHWISSRGQPTRDGSPAWRLGEVLTTQFKMLRIILQSLNFWQVEGARVCGNDALRFINCGEFLGTWGPPSFSKLICSLECNNQWRN
jgi:hypothetical protein